MKIPNFTKGELLYWLDWVKGRMQYHKAWTGMNDEIILLKIKEAVIEKSGK